MFKSFFLDRRWFLWSIVGSAVILYVTWYKVQIDVEVNQWFGSFYDLIQKALAKPNAVTFDEFLAGCIEFFNIVSVYIIIAVILDFFVRHYVFRWRTAMNNYYMKHWDKISHIEGASQRVQEDTMRFARIVESLGVSFMRSLMTLVAFLPILWTLSENVTELPWIGSVDRSLVYLAIISALFGTVLLAIVGIRLPGLEFKNQKVEAAYRKELVFGEDNPQRAKPETVKDLFFNVRKNYFNLYRHYLYFDIAKWSYIQYTVIVPYIALGPAIISGALTLGVLQQILRAFGKVEESFQFLVHSWSTIVELMSIYKRLRAFEVQINDAINVETISVE
ncbi:peptide antibiotic transporter SbmA [Photobacterium iliopiscarium]|jgi:peptide/bleomycin uptake transporter|uniref:Peptide antibiotic transporter SbmA n=1 Tax=Photobacterium iliopiscarium TaxID=56192 RepID=A0A2T3MQK4_9GAMM|nr:peptide antibiotic transporter SbmA [Photobacterium iliopiscarium]PST97160.1 peptide antibiotic transporter SbmA [Photobacterium iliopiscarium]PSU01911.1 peptide antibiotic transporter SbmA [Photobacterium iliopiscarium]PSV84259.1 peptide antibiotic transporter SbmA [Photobacterium iliopiscarium]PSV99282.1 peptide antibiotic transporter SbmA [Photobacterium iliopiscarium]